MARATRNTNIDTRSQRLKLPQGKRYWQTIGKGLAIGYRRGKNGGTWYARHSLPDNKYVTAKLSTYCSSYRDGQ